MALTPGRLVVPLRPRPARPQHPPGADLPRARRGEPRRWRRSPPACCSPRPRSSAGCRRVSCATRSLETLPKAHLHLHFTGSMRHEHPARARRARRPPPARGADRGLAAGAVRRRREGLVPLPAALRRGPVGAAHRGRRPPARARGRRGRPARRRPLAGDPGRPQRVRRQVRRHHRLHRPGPRRRRERLARRGHRDGGGDRRQPHPAPARRPHAGPPRRAVRRPRGGRLRPVQRRASRHDPRLRSGLPDRRAGRTAARAARRRAGRTRPHPGLRGGPARRPARPRRPRRRGPRPARPDRRSAASPSRSARCPTSRSGSTPT